MNHRAERQLDVADMVNELFEERWPDGYKNANTIVADFVSREIGRPVDRQLIYRLRTRQTSKVDAAVLSAIGKYFGMIPGYFAARASDPTDPDDLAVTLRDTGLQLVGLRSQDLTPQARAELARLARMAADMLDTEAADINQTTG